MTKFEAAHYADKLLHSMKTKGWEIRMHENLGWHYKLVLPIEGTNGGASIRAVSNDGPYFCMITTSYLGTGQQGLYDPKPCDDPNKAFENSLATFEKLTNFLDQIKKTAILKS